MKKIKNKLLPLLFFFLALITMQTHAGVEDHPDVLEADDKLWKQLMEDPAALEAIDKLWEQKIKELYIGEWYFVAKNKIGTSYFIDESTIKEENGHIMYWYLMSAVEPYPGGALSSKTYSKLDCERVGVGQEKEGNFWQVKEKSLLSLFYTQPMGEGSLMDPYINSPREKWRYIQPNTVFKAVAEAVCVRASMKKSNAQWRKMQE